MLETKIAALRDSVTEQRFKFISAEIDLAFTFCEVARTIRKKAVVQRNIKNAKKADSATETE